MTTEAAGREDTQPPRTRGRRHAGCSPTAPVRMAGRPRQRLARRPCQHRQRFGRHVRPAAVRHAPSVTHKGQESSGFAGDQTATHQNRHVLRSTLTSPVGAPAPVPAVLTPPAGAFSWQQPPARPLEHDKKGIIVRECLLQRATSTWIWRAFGEQCGQTRASSSAQLSSDLTRSGHRISGITTDSMAWRPSRAAAKAAAKLGCLSPGARGNQHSGDPFPFLHPLESG